jgi:hypothetical protein
LPAVTYGAECRLIEWKLPVYNTILHILTNPIYAGAYAFGRTGSRISIEAGRKKVVRGFKKERKVSNPRASKSTRRTLAKGVSISAPSTTTTSSYWT